MSDVITALGGLTAVGLVTISDGGLRGMITLRGDLADPILRGAVTDLTGLEVPGTREIQQSGDHGLAWMSPDELLLMVPYDHATEAVSKLGSALKGIPHLVADVSDARTTIVLEGTGLREVLAKGAPVDLRTSRFRPGEFRRTRLGQVAVAFWLTSETRGELVCFRSVSGFVFGWLANAALDDAGMSYF